MIYNSAVLGLQASHIHRIYSVGYLGGGGEYVNEVLICTSTTKQYMGYTLIYYPHTKFHVHLVIILSFMCIW